MIYGRSGNGSLNKHRCGSGILKYVLIISCYEKLIEVILKWMNETEKHHQKMKCCGKDVNDTYKLCILLKTRQEKKWPYVLTVSSDTFKVYEGFLHQN